MAYRPTTTGGALFVAAAAVVFDADEAADAVEVLYDAPAVLATGLEDVAVVEVVLLAAVAPTMIGPLRCCCCCAAGAYAVGFVCAAG